MVSRARARGALPIALALAAALAGAGPAAAARPPRLEYHGSVLSRAVAEALFARALRAAPGSASDSAAISTALGTMVARLQDLGFLAARAEAERAAGSDPRLVVRVREGERRRFRAITILTASPPDSARFATALGLAPGEWASPSAARDAVGRALGAAVAAGHPYASLGVSGWGTDSAGVALTLAGELGPEVTVAGARVEGLHVTRPAVLARALAGLAGRPFRPLEAEAARDRIARLGLFESVRYEGLDPEPDGHRARLVFRVVEPRYNQFEGAVGVQGAAGAVGTARVELGNLMGSGRALGVRWEARGPGLSDLAAHFAEPFVLGTPLAIELAVAHQVQDTLWVRTRWGASGHVALGGTQRAEAGYEEERVVQSSGEVQEADLHTTRVAFERGVPEAASGPRRLARLVLAATQSFKTEQLRPDSEGAAPRSRRSQAGSADLSLQARRPLGAAGGIGIELRAAARFSTQRVLPLYERFPLGGATTLRGYDEEQFRADRFALARLEWSRWLGPAGARAFLFWDHAWLATRLADPVGDHLQTLARDGVGFGLRLGTAGGLAGLDYGLEPGRPPLEGKVHLQLITTF